MIVVILGQAGSGKTTISSELSKRLDCEFIDVSKIVEEVTSASKRKQGRAFLQKVHETQTDPNWLANPLLERVGSHNRVIIVVGIREPYLLYRLHDVDDVLIFSIEVNEYERYCRLCQRDRFISVEDFLNYDKGDQLLGLDITLESAHCIIDGNDTIDKVVNAIEVNLFQHDIRSDRKLGDL